MNSTNLTMEERAQIQFYAHMALEPMDDQSAVWNSIPEAEGYNCSLNIPAKSLLTTC